MTWSSKGKISFAERENNAQFSREEIFPGGERAISIERLAFAGFFHPARVLAILEKTGMFSRKNWATR